MAGAVVQCEFEAVGKAHRVYDVPDKRDRLSHMTSVKPADGQDDHAGCGRGRRRQ